MFHIFLLFHRQLLDFVFLRGRGARTYEKLEKYERSMFRKAKKRNIEKGTRTKKKKPFVLDLQISIFFFPQCTFVF